MAARSLFSKLPVTRTQPIAGPSSRSSIARQPHPRASVSSPSSPLSRSYASQTPRPSRTGPRPGPGRPAAAETGTGTGTELPNVKELMSRKSFAEAWRGLTQNQKLAFGAFVLIGGAGEYFLLKSWIIDPIKAKKEEQKRSALEKDVKAAGGGEREVLLEAQ
ncbi:hypothetical protein IAT40_006205 [Kwoniella sp. CBS 6097]